MKRPFNVAAFKECVALSMWGSDWRSRLILLLIGLLVRMSPQRRVWIRRMIQKKLQQFAQSSLLKFSITTPNNLKTQSRSSELSLVLSHDDGANYQSLDECFGAMYPLPQADIKYILDAGAHVGFFSIANACRLASCEEIVAVEPDPDNLSLLRRNVSQVPVIKVVPNVLSASEDTVQFERAASNTGHIAGSPGHSDTGSTISIESQSLFSLLPQSWRRNGHG